MSVSMHVEGVVGGVERRDVRYQDVRSHFFKDLWRDQTPFCVSFNLITMRDLGPLNIFEEIFEGTEICRALYIDVPSLKGRDSLRMGRSTDY
jgi:hypothetical protein